MKSKFKAMVLSCMDPRFQHLVHNHLKKKKLTGKYSAFTIAGAAVGVTHNKFKKWHKTFDDNLATSIQLHKIEKLIVINASVRTLKLTISIEEPFNDLLQLSEISSTIYLP